VTRRAGAHRGRALQRPAEAAAWDGARQAAASLVVLRAVLEDRAGAAWRDLVAALSHGPARAAAATTAYARLFSLLADEAELSATPLVGDAWQHHLLSRLLDAETPFSRKAEAGGWDAMGPALAAQARADLAALERCYRLTGPALATAVARTAGAPVTPWDQFRPLGGGPGDSPRLALMRRFHRTRGWDRLARALADHVAEHGAGMFGRYRAFRWVGGRGGRLEGIRDPDPVTLNDLVGYEVERQPVLDNTRQFVAGGPANNVLLYGDRGTGKSSTVKALLNEYGDLGLRLIEVAKEDLGDYAAILDRLRGRRERFVLFVDDLSFEEHETQYKALKAALEGGLEARAPNVILYATSNRRHLVTERFADRRRASTDDEVHPEDAAQEKLSLADRFGIHAPFLVPDQERYLRIVAELASHHGLRVPAGELRRRALVWSQWHNGLSCRTARQFIDGLRGEALLAQARSNGRARRARGRVTPRNGSAAPTR